MCRTTTYVAAYPRRCGEHDEFVKSMDIDPGLPPQVRGAPIGPFHTFSCMRLTPAGAGSTSGALLASVTHRAYPRRCGEHDNALVTGYAHVGLPPQVRGALPT